MALASDVVAGVRQKLRDFPAVFQTQVVGDGLILIFELPVVMVDPALVNVSIVDTSQATPQLSELAPTEYTLDAHHGTVMLNNRPPLQTFETLIVAGTHYQWFLDDDIIAETTWFTTSLDESAEDDYFFAHFAVSDPRFELTLRGVLVSCLWSLLIEASLDIDVRNPEGVDIPASQRFAQLQNLVQVWAQRYEDLAERLNIGIDRIEILTLRRKSLSTGRLVPIYIEQEFEDQATPKRLFPLIDNDQTLGDPPPGPTIHLPGQGG